MTHLVPLDLTPDFAPREDKALPERLIEGDPTFKTWELDCAQAETAKWGKIRTGIWEATPGTTKSIKGETFEFCHILSGHVRLSEEGGESRDFTAGDSFVLKPGFVGTWHTIETVRKIWVIAA
ncbi:cupin domain-containing protein [Pseudodonghicola xiamenensis]|uniref:Cupin n=1 Tax=Pseudodonghicola xiamenensis TaxID=337702 RepID=A0A8J3H9Y4_9RHOB|nr:cupin domain-containing protein [Pseudodonghicola xiamenensis]GHG96054.1 cupin [Pseudodonghicola xiamenensis]